MDALVSWLVLFILIFVFVRLALLKTKSKGRRGGRKDLAEEMLARRRTSRTGVDGGESIRERWRPGQPGCRPEKSDLRKITKNKMSMLSTDFYCSLKFSN